MRSISDLVGESSADTTPDRECYRCDRDVATGQLFRLSLEPPDGLTGQYADATRYCCRDCAAGLGMLEVTDRWTEVPHSVAER